MDKIVDIIGNLSDLNHLSPASEAEIKKAEEDLGLTFADDYKAYTRSFGAISADGIELTGVTTSKRLDVVAVTKAERELSGISSEMYVIENVAIEGIIILQDHTGAIYQSAPNHVPKKIYASLSEYIINR